MSTGHKINQSISFEFKGTLTLTDQKADANTTHIKSIQPRLQFETNFLFVLISFPFLNALSHSCDSGIVSSFDFLETLCKAGVIFVNFWWPFDVTSMCVVPTVINTRWTDGVRTAGIPSFHWDAELCPALEGVAKAETELVNGKIGRRLRELETVGVWSVQSLSNLIGEFRFREGNELLVSR